MAYLTPETNRRRIVALGAVGAVHGVMAVVLLTGFAGGIIEKIKPKEWTKAWTYMPPPPAASPVPDVKPVPHTRDTAPKPDLTLPKPQMDDSSFQIGRAHV